MLVARLKRALMPLPPKATAPPRGESKPETARLLATSTGWMPPEGPACDQYCVELRYWPMRFAPGAYMVCAGANGSKAIASGIWTVKAAFALSVEPDELLISTEYWPA